MPSVSTRFTGNNFAVEAAPQSLRPVEEPDFLSEVIPAAFRLENSLLSQLSNNVDQPGYGEYDYGFDPLAFIPEDQVQHADRYAQAFNEQHAIQIRDQIYREQQDRDTVEMAGGAGIGAMIAAGVFDPINFIPVGGAAYRSYRVGDSILKGAGQTALAGLAATSMTEVALHSSQQIRTPEESAFNIAAGTILSGIIGAGATALTKQAGKWDDAVRQFQDDMQIKESDGNLSAAQTGSIRDPETGELRPTTLEEEGLAGGGGVQGTAKAAGFVDPTMSAATSQSRDTRVVMQDLAETAPTRAKNEAGVESSLPAEAIARAYQRNLYTFLKGLDDDYITYLKGRKKQFGDVAVAQLGRMVGIGSQRVSHAEFRSLVARAARRGDKVTDDMGELSPRVQDALRTSPDLRKAVETAAKRYRDDIVTPLKEEAIRLKIFTEDVDAKTAESYLNRTYNVERLRHEQEDFVAAVVGWLKENQAAARTRAGEFASKEAQAKQAIKDLRRDIRLTHSTTYRETMEDALRDSEKVVFDLFTDMFAKGFEIPLRTPAELAQQAKDAAQRSFQSTYRKVLREKLERAMAEDAEAFENFVIDQALKLGKEDLTEEMLKNISFPTSSALGEGNAAAVMRAFDEAAREATAAARTSAEKLLKRKLQRAKGGEDPEKAFDRLVTELNQSIRKNARKASKQAASKATAKIRENLTDNVRGLAKLRKQQAKDVIEGDLIDAELVNTARRIHSRIINSPAGRLPYDYDINTGTAFSAGEKPQGLSGPFKERKFLIPDETIERWLDNDIELSSKALIRSMAPDLALMQKFGDVNMTEQFQRIEDGYQAKIAKAKNPAEVKKLTQARDRDMLNVRITRDRLRGTHGLPADPAAWGPRMGGAIRKLNYVRLLGGMTISAIPDLARVMMVNGFMNSFGDVLVPLMTNFHQMSKQFAELRDMGLAADMILNTRMNAIADIADDYHRLSKVERGIGTMADTFGAASLMAPWNTMLKQLAGASTQARMVRAIKADAAGTISKTERTFLRANYISADMAKTIKSQLDEFGSESENGLLLSGWGNWNNEAARSAFQAGLQREVNKIIVTPGLDQGTISIGGKALLTQETEIGKMFLQFKSFGIAATQRMLISGLQQKDASFLGGVMMSVALGTMVYKIKANASGIETPDPTENPQKWLIEGIDRSGIAGWFFEPNNMLEKVTRGHVGLSRLTGAGPMSRYANRNIVGALIGPSFGTATSAFGVVGSAVGAATSEEEWTDADTKAVRRLLPYQNLIGFRYVLDAVEQAASREPNQ